MNNDIDTTLAMSLIKNKPDGMDIVDYVINTQSKIMEKENELFFKEFLYDSQSNKVPEQYLNKENTPLSFLDFQSFDKLYNNMSPSKNIKFECEITSSSYGINNCIQTSNTCLVQPLITMKTLSETVKSLTDSGYNTNDWKINDQNADQKSIEVMSQSIQVALDLLTYTLFDSSKLFDVVINWNDSNNLVKYFVDLGTSMADSNEFIFTCRDNVILSIQNIVIKILDNHHLYNSIHIEYQLNLFAQFCYDKYIQWNIINLLINHLKVDVLNKFNSGTLRRIFYMFHLINKLLQNIGFIDATTENTKNINCLTNLWKLNKTNKNRNDTVLKQMLNKWNHVLKYITMETLKNNEFLVSIRANQCLETLKLITLE